MTRPDPGRPAPGCEFVAVPDKDWRVYNAGAAGIPGRQCRYMEGRKACGKAAVARFDRRYRLSARQRSSWWAYCGEHMYGRWIEDGKVMVWIAREIKADS
jgi:hypothetical protein